MNRLLIASAIAVAAFSVPVTAALASSSHDDGHSPVRAPDSISTSISGSDDSVTSRSATSTPTSAPSDTSMGAETHGREAEPGDDRGSATTEPGDDTGGHSGNPDDGSGHH